MKALILVTFIFFFGACSHTIYQSDTLLKSSLDIPHTYVMGDVSFVKQEQYYCGPATLSMAMDKAGKRLSMEELAAQMFTPGKKGSFQTDLLSTARRNGMMAVQIDQKLAAILQELAAGHPVIVYQNLGFSWFPQWHYALAIGYDLTHSTIILHSGEEPYKKVPFKDFEKAWAGGNHWAVVILSPLELSATADDFKHVISAASLEQYGKITEAELAYISILNRFPKSFGALIGMGNIKFQQNHYKESVKYLELATRYHRDSAIAWHNLATAQGALKRKNDAKISSHRALSLVDNKDKDQFTESLQEWL